MMQHIRFSFSTRASLALPPTAVGGLLIIYALLTVGLAFLAQLSPLLALMGGCGINLAILFILWPRLALPFYTLIAGPTIPFPLGSSGVLARLCVGNVLFVLIVGIWLLRSGLPGHNSRQKLLKLRLVAPFVCIVLIGFISIIISRLFPDPNVNYAFRNAADVPITVVNLTEMSLLLCILLLVLVVPGFMRTLKDVRWLLGAYTGIGIVYALGTVFAEPLHLLSSEVLLGVTRPQVFGLTSGTLGLLLVLFCCITLSQFLYARKPAMRLWCGILTLLFALSVIMSFARESWIMIFVSVSVILTVRFKNGLWLLILLACLPLFFLTPLSDFFDPSKVYGIDRLIMMQDAINIWQRHPFLGIGAGNYQFFDIA